MKDFTVSVRLGALIILPLIALLMIVSLSIKDFGDINAGIGRIYDDRVVPLAQLKLIADDYAVLVIDAINKADNDIISPPDALEKIHKADERITKNWELYTRSKLTAEEKKLVNEAQLLFHEANLAIQKVEATLSEMGSNNNGELKKTMVRSMKKLILLVKRLPLS